MALASNLEKKRAFTRKWSEKKSAFFYVENETGASTWILPHDGEITFDNVNGLTTPHEGKS